ncbi:MAG: endonuclease/exonuclease/phosphatase family protein [Bacteriovoracaceae bacterium]
MGQKIITSNIRFDNPADLEDPWSFRRQFLAEILLSHQPTIICTQEGRRPQLEDFATLLPDYILIEANRPWIEQRMYPTLFLRKGDWQVHDSGDKWLSLTPDEPGSVAFESSFPRLFTWAHATHKHSSKKCLLINTHLDHVLESTRLSQIEVLAQEIIKLIKSDEKVILMGDFNDSPDGSVRKHLFKLLPFICDPWKELGQIEETSFHPFTGVNEQGARIDWVLLDKRIHFKKIFLDKTERTGKYPSDHFPVVCEIML